MFDMRSPQVECEGGEGGEAQHDEADAVLPARHCAKTQRQRHGHLLSTVQVYDAPPNHHAENQVADRR